MAAKVAARIAYHGDNKRQKWVYQCAACRSFFKGAEVQVDHIIPTGGLTSLEELAGFVERLTVEEGFQVLCKGCHKKKTEAEKNEGKI
ncbi:unnamed protein product [marine sediment metagenome]|uniref:Uncharacterized protein n=1 Tax=marine sediment metagenome TaxID=412755 RepID=X0ZS54_9ZZZZ